MKEMNKLLWYLLCCLPLSAFAQQKMEIGVLGGFANYQGDLVENPIAISETRLSYGGFLRYHLHNKFKVRGNFMYGYISGSDANSDDIGFKERGWSFESNIFEASLIGEFHPLGRNRTGETGLFRRQISPYIGAGAGMATFTPKVKVTDSADADLFPEQGEQSVSVSLPILAGVRVDVFEFLSLGVEVGWRATFNDYLDGVSKNGNNDKNDWYLIGGITASFFLGNSDPDYNFSPK